MRRIVAAAVVAAGLGLIAEPALAIPAFARRYKVECHFCHDIYPKLNLMGQRFKERGFRMEREETFEVANWARTAPLSVRAMGNRSFVQDGDGSSFGYVKGVSAGNLGDRISYWADDAVIFTEGDDNFTHIKPDNLWARVEIVRGGRLYAKGGRFELDIPFTQTRTPHLFGYDIYFANTGSESDSVARHQEGVEVGGELGSGARWSAALGMSRYFAINLDIGHFTAANYDPVEFIKANHEKILVLHLKDRKRDEGPNTSWGEGDTPIQSVLQLLKREQYPMRALIEYEYRGAADSVTEVKKCFEYAKAALA